MCNLKNLDIIKTEEPDDVKEINVYTAIHQAG